MKGYFIANYIFVAEVTFKTFLETLLTLAKRHILNERSWETEILPNIFVREYITENILLKAFVSNGLFASNLSW